MVPQGVSRLFRTKVPVPGTFSFRYDANMQPIISIEFYTFPFTANVQGHSNLDDFTSPVKMY